MTLACAAPDPALGVALRLSTFADCHARALGENGFQALIGGPIVAGLLSGLVTIFIALIGYRLILGEPLPLRDSGGWAARLGMVLALVTAWPAFQTLVYDVATKGPGELAGVLLPASGLPATDLDGRVQQAYDTMRLGVTPSTSEPDAQPITTAAQIGQSNGAQQQPGTVPQPSSRSSAAGQLPQTASVFALSTTGVSAAFKIAIGFLLAVAPLAILALLFDATLGVFSGWVRALAGAALALVAATVVTAIDLVMVEGELAKLQLYGQGMIADVVDLQGLTTLVHAFAVAMLVTAALALRMANAFTLRPALLIATEAQSGAAAPEARPLNSLRQSSAVATSTLAATRPRSAAIAEALALSVTREQSALPTSFGGETGSAPSRQLLVTQGLAQRAADEQRPSGQTGRRRALARRTRSAAARDLNL